GCILASMLLKVLVLLDVGFEGRSLLLRGESTRAYGEWHEVHFGGVPWDVDQIVARRAVAVHITSEDVTRSGAEVRVRRLGLEERGNRRAAEPEVLTVIGGLHEYAMPLCGIVDPKTRVVGVKRDFVAEPGSRSV